MFTHQPHHTQSFNIICYCDSGADFGLKLLINAQTYEYAGAYDKADAGIKVLSSFAFVIMRNKI